MFPFSIDMWPRENFKFEQITVIVISLALMKLVGNITEKVLYYLNEKDKRRVLSEERKEKELLSQIKQEKQTQEFDSTDFCIHVHGQRLIGFSEDKSCGVEGVPSTEVSTSDDNSYCDLSQEQKLEAVRDELQKINEGDYSSIDSSP